MKEKFEEVKIRHSNNLNFDEGFIFENQSTADLQWDDFPPEAALIEKVQPKVQNCPEFQGKYADFEEFNRAKPRRRLIFSNPAQLHETNLRNSADLRNFCSQSPGNALNFKELQKTPPPTSEEKCRTWINNGKNWRRMNTCYEISDTEFSDLEKMSFAKICCGEPCCSKLEVSRNIQISPKPKILITGNFVQPKNVVRRSRGPLESPARGVAAENKNIENGRISILTIISYVSHLVLLVGILVYGFYYFKINFTNLFDYFYSENVAPFLADCITTFLILLIISSCIFGVWKIFNCQ